MGKETLHKQRVAWGRYLLVLFVAAWMFVLGVMVGRGRAPVEFDTQALTKELAGLRAAMVKKQQDDIEKEVRGENKKHMADDFHEALQRDRPDTAVGIAPTNSGSGTFESGAKGPPHKTRAELLPKRRDQKVNEQQSTKTSQPTEQTASSPERLTIQVAALKDATAAEQILDDLKDQGYSAYLTRTVIPGQGLWLRVRVGSYASSEEAAPDLARLKSANRKPILIEK